MYMQWAFLAHGSSCDSTSILSKRRLVQFDEDPLSASEISASRSASSARPLSLTVVLAIA